MRVAIVHQEIKPDAPLDEQDTRLQADAIDATLRSLGHETLRLGATLNLADLDGELRNDRPDVIFNLVESLAGSDRLLFLAPAVYDALGVRYTGSPTESLVITSNKLLAKQQMLLAGLPTAQWCGSQARDRSPELPFPARYIFKCVFEHGSWGMDEAAVIEVHCEEDLQAEVSRRERATGRTWFAERYIAGREFNVALIETADGPRVLPIGEIEFANFSDDKPKIVCYQAKWAEESFEYVNTPRRFGFASSDRELIAELERLALESWQHFHLKGYARVDFRVDESGRPWILEINANPCLTPEAGFWAMLQEASIPYERAIGWILAAALPSPVRTPEVREVAPRRAGKVKLAPVRKEGRREPALAPRTGSE